MPDVRLDPADEKKLAGPDEMGDRPTRGLTTVTAARPTNRRRGLLPIPRAVTHPGPEARSNPALAARQPASQLEAACIDRLLRADSKHYAIYIPQYQCTSACLCHSLVRRTAAERMAKATIDASLTLFVYIQVV